MYWTEDGWLRLEGGGNRAKLEVLEPKSSIVHVPVSGAVEPSQPLGDREHFDGAWNIHLVTPRLSRHRFASTEERAGHLRLRGRQSLCSLDEVALVARRLTSIHAEAACALEFDPEDFRQSAGLVAYYDNMNYLYLRVCRNMGWRSRT